MPSRPARSCRTAFRRGAVPGFVLLLACWTGTVPAAPPTAGDLDALRARIATLQAELDEARGKQDREREKLRAIEVQIGNLHRDRRRIERDLARHGERLGELERERTARAREVAAQRHQLAAQVRAAHAMGRQEQLKIVLNQEDPARLGRLLGYYGYFNRARLARIAAIETALDRLRSVEDEVVAERARLDALHARHRESEAALEAERRERAELLARLAGRIEDHDRELARQRADEARLVKLLDSLQRALDEMPAVERVPFGKQRGRLGWPARGGFSADYGQARGVGGARWQGVVIDAAEGGEVRAVSHGRVAFADWLRGYGLLMILDHGDGYMTLYGYNQALNKEVGDWVEEGEVIASVGRSGGNARAGLYFEIRHRGRPIDPRRWCRADGGRRAG
ncbi:MAG: peptidoglycan DD-metalloendopeptidase family protein [Gammaproteobacteria bacterium]|nr:peptidoglycan DD-metalloendopeptidase family protein [Gammaproteobacteria bacterium]